MTRRREGAPRVARSGYFDDLYDPPGYHDPGASERMAAGQLATVPAGPEYQQRYERQGAGQAYQPAPPDVRQWDEPSSDERSWDERSRDERSWDERSWDERSWDERSRDERSWDASSPAGRSYDEQWWEEPGSAARQWTGTQPRDGWPDEASGSVAPGGQGAGNRLLIVILFWFGLAASVELWWLNNPIRTITGPGAALIAGGRITGMVSGFVLLAEVLTMSRVAWLERWVGAHDLLGWHRWLGGLLVTLVPTHAVLLILGYAAASGVSPLHETWSMLTLFEDMISAFVATGVLIVVGALAIRRIRRAMPYELWRLAHLGTYLVLLLGYGHQFALGAELIRPGFARWYWIALHVFVLVCLIWGRVLEPGWLNLRHRFRVIEVVREAPDMVSIYVGGRNLDKLDVRAGQYFRWRFLARRCWWQSHPFSLSAAPERDWLRVTVKAIGDHTRDLQNLRPGTWALVAGPFGAFTAERRFQPRALLVAVGAGIAPIRALLEDLPAGAVLLYRARTADDLVFHDELRDLAVRHDTRIHCVLGSRDSPEPRHTFTPAGIQALVPDIRDRDVYLCGPRDLISTVVKALRRLKVPRRQIHLDPFEF